MSTFYIVAEKSRSGLKSGNLSSNNYGEFEANSTHFLNLCGTSNAFLMYREIPQGLTPDKILLKVQADDNEIKHVAMYGKRDGNILKFQPGVADSTRTYVGNPTSFKIKVVSQVMPDGTERYKHNSELDEISAKNQVKEKNAKPLLRFATGIVQLGIDIKERNVGKENATKPTKRI